MKFMKQLYISLALGLLLGLGACTNLDETVYDSLTDETIDVNDPEIVGYMMGEVYAQFRFLYWGWNGYFDLNEECADTYMTPKRIGIGWGDLYVNMHKHTWNETQGHIEGLWYYAYVGIGYANKTLDVLPETGQAQAEMRFMRALNYYVLLDAFRNVPLEKTQQVEAGYLPEQVAGDTIFNFCVTELNAIKDDLGTEKIHGYPNRFAACMLLAKLYLNHNAWFKTDDNNYYELALAEVNEIITDGGYGLAPNYLDNFKADISGSPEIIFALPLDGKNASHNYLVNKCLVGAGAAAYGYNGSPWNGSCAIPQFIESYQDGDNRLSDTWAGGVQRMAVKDASGEYIPQSGDPIPFTTDDWAGEGVLNYSLAVHSIDNPGAYQQEGYRFVKSEIVAGDYGTYGNDVAFFRYADVLFMKAECLLRLDRDQQTAADLITEVRSRSFDSAAKAQRTVADLTGGSVYAYGHSEYTSEGYNNFDPASHLVTNEGGDDIELGGLLDDLGWEFVGEHHRRQDLVRFKMADGRNVFNGKSWFCKDATTETHWDYFPIPKSALDANISLKQNEGYQTAAAND
ncbi:RagB/SusD family nutrient uptake outer membrane protein [Mangrovibacterium marinum]|uniref:Putative outer membrane starch-binding protein n=1 Tax=Mangrovibacterium marinum TaxID=1639118 RepID=A0A2T5BYW8_9BACT|nr:RagB/SusD family nutrient uptake outer membrane protein [Mangrovibacterium marinum]PTN07445.1 putative outer membrane starch-binding protein [Mangrovibacterium marinum]